MEGSLEENLVNNSKHTLSTLGFSPLPFMNSFKHWDIGHKKNSYLTVALDGV